MKTSTAALFLLFTSLIVPSAFAEEKEKAEKSSPTKPEAKSEKEAAEEGEAEKEEKDVTGEAFGEIKLGATAAAVEKLFGKPESKGKDTLWDATAEWVQDWEYPAKGLTFHMMSTEKGADKVLSAIIAKEGCTRGIKIGSSAKEVEKAYADVKSDEGATPGETFVAGSIYGGIVFTFEKEKVTEIFIGAAAE